MKVLLSLALFALGCWGGLYAGMFVMAGWRRYGMRRCFRCCRLTWMSPKVRAVMDTYRAIFCSRCMPVGDQLAEVATEMRDDLMRAAYGKAKAEKN